MKKILLSMILLCTAISAWSVTEKTETIACNGTNQTIGASGIRVYCPSKTDTEEYWSVGSSTTEGLMIIPGGLIITKIVVKDDYSSLNCSQLTKSGNTWVQNGTYNKYDQILFTSSSSSSKVYSLEITYHKHGWEGCVTHHEAKEATCTEDGMTECWECDCGLFFKDKSCSEPLTESPVITAKGHTLEHNAPLAATCTADGNVEHWHCSDCGKNFEDKACTKQITTDLVIPAINHKNKEFNKAVAPTAEKEGNVAYWHCPDCDKYFGDEGCTKEITNWVLEKLVNMLHFNFKGSAVPVETEHYMNAAKFKFTDDGDVILTVNGESVTYDKDMIDKVKFSNGTPTARIKANEDPDKKGTYYSTFYSSLESYAVPEGFKAYRGEISKDGTKLNLTSVKDGVMQRGEGYILRGATSNDSIKVAEDTAGGVSGNVLLGTDVPIAALGANDYALSLGQNGVGFYLWNGKTIGANKAYLTLADPNIKALTFVFEEEGTTGIEAPSTSPKGESPVAYDLRGMRVSDSYKGIVIKNGKKVIR